MLFAGIAHLTLLREEFHALVPDWLPLKVDLAVVLSGWIEIAFGVFILFFPRFQVWTGIALALFFVAIFPGNVAQYLNAIDAFGLNSDSKRLGRLFFQPIIIMWALWSTGALKELRNRTTT